VISFSGEKARVSLSSQVRFEVRFYNSVGSVVAPTMLSDYANTSSLGIWFRDKIENITIPASAHAIRITAAKESGGLSGSVRRAMLNRGPVALPFEQPPIRISSDRDETGEIDVLDTTNAPVDAGATANDIQTVTDSGSGGTTASATINRLGGQSTIEVFAGISGTATAGTGPPYPIVVVLRRGGSGGTVIRTWTGLSGGHEPGLGGDPDVAYMGVNLTHTDTNTGTGSTQYHVTMSTTSYVESLEITATQTFDTG